MVAGVRVVAVALITAVGVLATTSAGAQELEQKRTFGLRGSGNSHVQMRAVMAPVQPAPGARSFVQIPVTVVLTIKDNSKVAEVCGLGPRITDALMQQWWEHPIPYDYLYDPAKTGHKMMMSYQRTGAQKAEDSRLIGAINAALGLHQVTQILVIKGAIHMGGGAVSKLPFSSVLGCSELAQKKKKKAGHHSAE